MDSTDTSFASFACFRDFCLFIPQSNDPHTKCRQLIFCQWIPQTTNVFWPLKRIPLNVASLHHLSEVSAINLLFLRLNFIVCQWTPQPILLMSLDSTRKFLTVTTWICADVFSLPDFYRLVKVSSSERLISVYVTKICVSE